MDVQKLDWSNQGFLKCEFISYNRPTLVTVGHPSNTHSFSSIACYGAERPNTPGLNHDGVMSAGNVVCGRCPKAAEVFSDPVILHLDDHSNGGTVKG